MASPDSPTCPTCQAVLVLGANGYDTFWSCPNGHGAACTMTAAYGHVQEDEIKAIWQGSTDAAAGERSCPMCGKPMVDVSVGVDADEVEAGQPGDGADTVTASVAVCREDELFWLDATVIGQLPKDIPNPAPPPVDEHALEAVRATFVAGLAASEERTGVLSRMASAVTGRRTPLTVDPISPSALPPLPPTAVRRRRRRKPRPHRLPHPRRPHRRPTSRVIGWLEHWWAGDPGTAFSDFAGIAGLLLTAAALLWAWWHTRCRVIWCYRPGRHPVRGTTWKVCPNHHTLAHHTALHRKHAAKHPNRLAHGESWTTAADTAAEPAVSPAAAAVAIADRGPATQP